MALLFTGACGYIGSHTARVFLEQTKENIIILDNLSTGFLEHVKALEHYYPNRVTFIQASLNDTQTLDTFFSKQQLIEPISAILHFGAKLLVEESVRLPLEYYTNNTLNTLELTKLCLKHKIKHFIFSSTAAVYGETNSSVNEENPLNPINPYGASKMMSERILLDTSKIEDFKCVILRYFNVVGACLKNDYSTPYTLGQRSLNATHLIKIACECAVGKRKKMGIFGTNYPTTDGTCIRDYIHVDDLANAHLASYQALLEKNQSEIYNVGYNQGYSVKEVIQKVKEISNNDFLVEILDKRQGDPANLIANNAKILKNTNFKPLYNDLDTIIKSALEWEEHLLKFQ
ncbi:UDP-glucose 4-epimerase GalE [Helicobacter cetorum]|uniref:UDP-glucose 4-epimerase n=1 Tax=Helicobacter cetorum (strain ATCC BAA-540 / CCUG 52418 / MIT 99-5656) TaxID=1163745 RepID=I0ERF5_HELCM|nr:UDP-glucose 4-epimerase GalE [Helicobacter cetorum]AFI05524.1 UDP-glucose 4-epimerase [Helicobacter cetorum MIT 99-5656]